MYYGDLVLLPKSITELAKCPVYKRREILSYLNILDCGTKDDLAIRVTTVKSGKTYLAFTREYHVLKNLITAAKTLIQLEKQMFLLDPRIVVKTRKVSTISSPTISTSRPRDSASVFQKQIKGFTPIPAGIDMEALEDIFKPLISLYSAGQTNSNEIELRIKSTVTANNVVSQRTRSIQILNL